MWIEISPCGGGSPCIRDSKVSESEEGAGTPATSQ
jgi:hypothetical protein